MKQNNPIKPMAPMYLPMESAPLQQSVVGGQSFDYTVTLSGAPPNDQAVTISTDHAEVFANLPSSVTVLAGHTSVTVSVQTNTVASSVSATLTASCNGGHANGMVTVTQ